jgi:hypothetical protein
MFRQVALIDDCFGQSHGVPETAEAWGRLQEDLRGCIREPDTVIVATVRRHIYRELCDIIDGRLSMFGTAVDISSPDCIIDGKEKLEILWSHTRGKQVS